MTQLLELENATICNMFYDGLELLLMIVSWALISLGGVGCMMLLHTQFKYACINSLCGFVYVLPTYDYGLAQTHTTKNHGKKGVCIILCYIHTYITY